MLRDTRITVEDILRWLASGMSVADIIADFPELNVDDVFTALEFSANSSTGSTYRYTDTNPTGRAYYRLRMTDLDDSYERSEVVTLSRRSAGFATTNVYPNPTQGAVRVEYEVAESAEMQFMVYDMVGSLLNTLKASVEAGFNIQSIDLSDYPTGVYSVAIDRNGKERMMRKVVKQ